jgi:hypothetical protein
LTVRVITHTAKSQVLSLGRTLFKFIRIPWTTMSYRDIVESRHKECEELDVGSIENGENH